MDPRDPMSIAQKPKQTVGANGSKPPLLTRVAVWICSIVASQFFGYTLAIGFGILLAAEILKPHTGRYPQLSWNVIAFSFGVAGFTAYGLVARAVQHEIRRGGSH